MFMNHNGETSKAKAIRRNKMEADYYAGCPEKKERKLAEKLVSELADVSGELTGDQVKILIDKIRTADYSTVTHMRVTIENRIAHYRNS